MKQILTIGAGAATGILIAALSSNAYAGVIAGAMTSLYIDYIYNNVWKPKAINKSFSAWWIPGNHNFSYR